VAKITEVPPPGKRKGPIRELVETVVVALVIALLVRTFLVEVYRVEGSSMAATLQTGERLLVNKFVYPYVHLPRPGDIIVFQYPRQPDRDFIKRVVAVQGDKVAIRAGKVYVNGRLFPEAPSALVADDERGEQVVPPDSVWVLGDNRNNSEDSRYFGEVPLKNIQGLAFFRMWPLTRVCHFVNSADLAANKGAGGVLPCP
jgi:signal peptidase I